VQEVHRQVGHLVLAILEHEGSSGDTRGVPGVTH